MTTLKDLLSQIESLQSQVAEVRQREVGEAIAKARSIIEEYQLTVNDIFPGSRGPKTASAGRKSGGKVAAKYRDPISGKTWTGRGLAPKWLAGKNRDDFLIQN